MENYWCAARLQPRREALATHCLGLAGYEVYLPRLREHRRIRGRSVEVRPLLFPGYIFVLIVLQWSAARYSPGIATLVMNGGGPARVPDRVIAEIKSRERGGLIELPKPRGLRRGDKVRIISGPFEDHLALYDGMASHERVAVLLRVLGAQQQCGGGGVMNLPPEELSFFFWAGAQLSPDVRPVFVARVVAVLDAHRDPGPGDFDRAIREGILGLWIPPAIEEVRGVTRWDQARAKFDRVSKMAQPVEEQRRRRLKPGHGYVPA